MYVDLTDELTWDVLDQSFTHNHADMLRSNLTLCCADMVHSVLSIILPHVLVRQAEISFHVEKVYLTLSTDHGTQEDNSHLAMMQRPQLLHIATLRELRMRPSTSVK